MKHSRSTLHDRDLAVRSIATVLKIDSPHSKAVDPDDGVVLMADSATLHWQWQVCARQKLAVLSSPDGTSTLRRSGGYVHSGAANLPTAAHMAPWALAGLQQL